MLKAFLIIISVIITLLLLMESITITNHGIILVFPVSWTNISSFLLSPNAYEYFYFGMILSFVISILWFFGNGD